MGLVHTLFLPAEQRGYGFFVSTWGQKITHDRDKGKGLNGYCCVSRGQHIFGKRNSRVMAKDTADCGSGRFVFYGAVNMRKPAKLAYNENRYCTRRSQTKNAGARYELACHTYRHRR